ELEEDLRDRVFILRMNCPYSDGVRDSAQPPRTEVELPDADDEHHHRRRQRDREDRRDGHGEVLGECERPEESSLLCDERKDRREGEGDDEERKEARPPDLLDRLNQDFPVV